MNVCYTAGCGVVTHLVSFSESYNWHIFLNAYRYLNSVNDILLPIIHTINVHHHKHGKGINDFLQVPSTS